MSEIRFRKVTNFTQHKKIIIDNLLKEPISFIRSLLIFRDKCLFYGLRNKDINFASSVMTVRATFPC